MSLSKHSFMVICMATILIAALSSGSEARGGRDGLGLRAGLTTDPDQFVIGAQAEFGPVLSSSYLVPSLDLGLDDRTTVVANVDLRFYLIPLPETGIYFYGSAGPTVVLSPDSDMGLSLTAGVHIPMKNRRRYNVEVRFGLGDIPELKIMAALMFGL